MEGGGGEEMREVEGGGVRGEGVRRGERWRGGRREVEGRGGEWWRGRG